MGHFDQHYNFVVNRKYAKGPVHRQKLSSIINNCTGELVSFAESYPTVGTNTKKKNQMLMVPPDLGLLPTLRIPKP